MGAIHSPLFLSCQNIHPILDDMTWPQEVGQLSKGYGPGSPTFYSICKRHVFFYIYYYEMDELLKAALTLEEVYSGLRDQRWSLIDDEGWMLNLITEESTIAVIIFLIGRVGFQMMEMISGFLLIHYIISQLILEETMTIYYNI